MLLSDFPLTPDNEPIIIDLETAWSEITYFIKVVCDYILISFEEHEIDLWTLLLGGVVFLSLSAAFTKIFNADMEILGFPQDEDDN